jgi:hypothetical protein
MDTAEAAKFAQRKRKEKNTAESQKLKAKSDELTW